MTEEGWTTKNGTSLPKKKPARSYDTNCKLTKWQIGGYNYGCLVLAMDAWVHREA